VPINSIHGAFFAMDVSDLVRHLLLLLDSGFIKNAVPSREKLGNYYFLTPEGILYYRRISDQKS